ncbi:hypothetical protein [Paracoccus niistensis]|uniref:Uncharacterized protein n=1 Tax=Paracoccus niistensis TaxID=632935 RepID=A0ABV6I0K8_9RHOB
MARSEEAKALGIRMGAPVFKIRTSCSATGSRPCPPTTRFMAT